MPIYVTGDDKYVNKVQLSNGTTLMDLTGDTVTTGDVLTGKTFHLASGAGGTGTLSDFTGADGTNAGAHGLVPAPSATDNEKFLQGDGTWETVVTCQKLSIFLDENDWEHITALNDDYYKQVSSIFYAEGADVVIVTPGTQSMKDWVKFNLMCTNQASNGDLTFRAETLPNVTIWVNLLIMRW